MRAILPFLAFALTVTAFAGCLDSGEAMSADRPLWKSGYTFSYETTGFLKSEVKSEGGDEKGNEHQERPLGPFVAHQEVLNTLYKNGDVPVYVSAYTQTSKDAKPQPAPAVQDANGKTVAVPTPAVERAQLMAHRQRDLASVPTGAGVQRSCANNVCSTTLGTITFGDDPKHTYVDFPLSKGKTWSGVTNSDHEGDLVWAIQAKAGGAASVDLVPGRVRAIPIEFTFTPKNLDEVLNKAKAEDGVDQAQYNPTMHLKVFYAPDYQTVVRTEYFERSDATISGTRDGKAYRTEFHNEVTAVTVLTGAKLVARPERDTDYIAKVMMGEIAIGDPTGQAQKPVGYSLELTPSAKTLNAAESPDVSFVGKIVGDASGFTGHTAKWRLVDFSGTEVAKGDGLSFSTKIAKPGYYTAELETLDASGRTAASASAFVVANYESVVHATCAIVAAEPFLPGCATINIPVLPGVQKVTVGAHGDSPVAQLVSGELDVTDPKGHAYTDGSSTGGAYEVAITDFKDAAITGGDWTVQLVESRAVGQQGVDYTVKMDYTRPEPKGTKTEPAPTSFGVGVPALGLDLDPLA